MLNRLFNITLNWQFLSKNVMYATNLKYMIWNSDIIERKCLNDWFAFEISEIEEESGDHRWYCYIHTWEWPKNEFYGTKSKTRMKVLDSICMSPEGAKIWKDDKITWYLQNPKEIFKGKVNRKDVYGRMLNKRYSYVHHR